MALKELSVLTIILLLSSHDVRVLAQAPTQRPTQQPPSIIVAPINIFQSQPDGFFNPIAGIAVGMPPQPVRAIFDTGSSDLIVPATESPLCMSDRAMCTPRSSFTTGSFSANASSTVENTSTRLNTSFANGQNFQGDFLRDTLIIGNQSVPRVQFGRMTTGNLADGQLFPVFGVGPIQGESTNDGSGQGEATYANIPATMKSAGLIKSNIFGVYMNDFRNGQGSVTFGGIDTAKFTGQLQEAPLVPANNGQIPSFVVDFSSIELSGDQNASSNVNSVQLTPNDGLPPVLLDTGNPLVSIPEESAQGLARALGTTFDVQNGFGAVPCNIGNQGQKVTFGFNRNQAKVSVPLEMLLVPSTTVGLNGPPMAGETNGGNATGSNTSGSVGTQSDGDMDNSAEDDAESQGGRNSTVVGKGKGKGKGKDRGGKGQGGKGKGNRRGGKSNRRCNRRNRRGKCRNRHRTGNRNGNRFGNRNGNRNNRNNRQSRAIASSRRILARQAAAATGQCFLAVDASRNGLASLGAPFFQAAYVVFDNEQQRLLVAQAVVNSTTTNLQYLSA